MDSYLESRLAEKGEELVENHDEAVIADVIGSVEAMENESSDATATILRAMVEPHL
jgi:hypothetical protein